ncbi:MAG: tetratricopeptide repeat protein [Pontixanthobacter sp.]
MISQKSRTLFAGLALFAAIGTSMPAVAQSSGDEARLRKIESEVRALQRQVFPGGDGRFFEPQITATPQTGSTSSATSTTAVTDILIRLDALEAQIASLTSQTEENSNAIMTLTQRLVALENSPGTGSAVAATPAPTPAPASTATKPSTAAVTTPAVAVAAPTAARLEAVKQIAKPQTDDAADDEYSYGYRLWNAGFYPEAQQQLSMFVEKYPTHWRATYGRNLLGRAYLDDGKASEAAPWFFKNYQTNKQDARAPDSLLMLGESMIALKDTNRACIALAEFAETYPALAAGRLADQYQANLKKVKCN